jgi:hypothetical protein
MATNTFDATRDFYLPGLDVWDYATERGSHNDDHRVEISGGIKLSIAFCTWIASVVSDS